jgi:hypothetical protein
MKQIPFSSVSFQNSIDSQCPFVLHWQFYFSVYEPHKQHKLSLLSLFHFSVIPFIKVNSNETSLLQHFIILPNFKLINLYVNQNKSLVQIKYEKIISLLNSSPSKQFTDSSAFQRVTATRIDHILNKKNPKTDYWCRNYERKPTELWPPSTPNNFLRSYSKSSCKTLNS